MMTRTHYENIAALVNDLATTTSDPSQAADIAVSDFIDDLADYFFADNPRFDRKKFLTACGLSR